MSRALAKKKSAPKRDRKPKLKLVKPVEEEPGVVVVDNEVDNELDEVLDDLYAGDDDYDDNKLMAGVVGVESVVVEPEIVVPSHGTLMAAGMQKIGRAELALIEPPEATRTHQTIKHLTIVETLEEALAFRHIQIVAEEYAVSPDGGKMFGLLELNNEWNGLRYAIGLRNSNDKSMKLAMTIGGRVVVCANMLLLGDFRPVFKRHSKSLDLIDTISIGVDKMQRSFEPMKAQITGWQERQLTDEEARLIIYKAFLENRFPGNAMRETHRQYFRPQYPEFEPRTLYSLNNAFTSAFKLLKAVRQYQETARLGNYFNSL